MRRRSRGRSPVWRRAPRRTRRTSRAARTRTRRGSSARSTGLGSRRAARAIADDRGSSRIGGAALQVAVEPRDDTVQPIEEVLLLAQAVRLARVEHEIGVDVVALEAAIELLALADRVGQVVFALQQQRRRLDV